MAFPAGIDLTRIEADDEVVAGVRVLCTSGHSPGHQSVVIDGAAEARTIMCCQASWNALGFGTATLGGGGWDQAAGGPRSKLHALNPDRVLFSHDSRSWSPAT